METGAFGDAVGDKAAKDLGPAVEGEPDSDAGALFFFGVPLGVLVERLGRGMCDGPTCEVNSAKPGVTAASKTPRKNRTATAPAKFLQAAIQQSTRPHMMIQKDEYLARGSDCSSLFVGYSHARYPNPNQQLVFFC